MSGLNYRREIDGLRTVAVVPVILFHAGVEALAGGFVGVDIFFVISGFLITSIIARELDMGNFSILRFYERRARRILPALFFVLIVTTIMAYFIMLPYELADYGRWLNGVIFFVSNIVFWRESGYFAGASELNPLLHTWSLAVEEQFYIFFPPFLLLIWRWRMRAVWLILGALALGSLMLSDFLATRMAGANFYLLPTRAWELLCGSLLALYLMRKPQPTGMLAEALGLGGLVAIAATLFFYSSATPFPSFYALLPVLGTMAVLMAASPQTLVGRFLGWSPMVGIGLISYSAYLWHQPLFVFARLQAPGNHPAVIIMLGLSALAIGLGWLSWRFVEAPFRTKKSKSQGQVFGASAAVGAIFAGLGAAFFYGNGFIQRYPVGEAQILTQSNASFGEYVETKYRQVLNQPLSVNQPNLVLVGDSFSQDFYNIIEEAGAFKNYAISALYIPARCQISYGKDYADIQRFIAAEDRRMCESRGLTQANVDAISQADVVIFAARWQEWAASGLADTLRAMDIPDTTQVIVVGSKVFEANRRDVLMAFRKKGAAATAVTSEGDLTVNATLKAQSEGVLFVDILGDFCAQGCPLFTLDGAMISYDGNHLTPDGAEALSQTLFDGPLKNVAFDAASGT